MAEQMVCTECGHADHAEGSLFCARCSAELTRLEDSADVEADNKGEIPGSTGGRILKGLAVGGSILLLIVVLVIIGVSARNSDTVEEALPATATLNPVPLNLQHTVRLYPLPMGQSWAGDWIEASSGLSVYLEENDFLQLRDASGLVGWVSRFDLSSDEFEYAYLAGVVVTRRRMTATPSNTPTYTPEPTATPVGIPISLNHKVRWHTGPRGQSWAGEWVDQVDDIVVYGLSRDRRWIEARKDGDSIGWLQIDQLTDEEFDRSLLSSLQLPPTFTPRPPTQTPRPTRRPVGTYGFVVRYRLTGTADNVGVTLENDRGGTQQFDVNIPYEIVLTDFQQRDFVYVSAQNNGDSGSVKCQIIVNDQVQYEATSVGAYTIASCSGTVK